MTLRNHYEKIISLFYLPGDILIHVESKMLIHSVNSRQQNYKYITRKWFSEKPIVAFTNRTVFILDILLSLFGLKLGTFFHI